MTIKTTLKSAIAAAALTLAVATQANAETAFGTLAGIEAEPMSAAEMEATQGRSILTGFNGLTGQFGICVAGSCTGSHFGNLFHSGTPAGAVHPWINYNFGDPSTFAGWIGQVASHQPLYLQLQQMGFPVTGPNAAPIHFQSPAPTFTVDGFANMIANLPLPR
jgi:hypothetical protein